MSEILPRVHRIESVFDNRWICAYLLLGERALLVDSGFAPTAADVILPYLRRINLDPDALAWLIVTHASGDHFGGNSAIKQWAPNVTIVAHQQDAAAIASHATYLAEHFAALGDEGVPVPLLRVDDPSFLDLHGPEVAVDWQVNGGERLALSPEWEVELVHLPGHTPGHLAVYDPQTQALLAGDALMGDGVPNTAGQLTMPPHYFDVDWYLATLGRARDLRPAAVLATHYPPQCGPAATAFVAASAAFVSRMQALLPRLLQTAGRPLDIPSLIEAVRAHLGIPGADYQYGLLLRAHLRRLQRVGRAEPVTTAGRHMWTWQPA